jgi:Family of unknown function (DUF6155)
MAKKEIRLGVLKPYLKQAPREQLAADISELFTKFEVVRDYYQAKLFPERETGVIERYKAIITNEFFPPRGFGQARLSIARKAVADYKKVCRSKASLADLMLFYVETGVEFTNTYGDIDAPFYDSMGSMYKKAVEFIVENELQEAFERRCKRIVSETAEIGWGFHDALSYLYENNFEG